MMYRLAQNLELFKRNGEHFLMIKTPLNILRLNPSLHRLVTRGLSGPLTPVSKGESDVLEQLAAKGFVERVRDHSEGLFTHPSVSIVIPVKDREEELSRCLASLARLKYPKDRIQIIVVDDGSSDMSPLIARLSGAHVVPSGGTGRGPAAARNAGAAAAKGEILAFIDSDCTASDNWLNELIPAFSDPKTAAVGGLVDGMCTESMVDRYEACMSSLSLGSRERSGNSGDDTFYLPSCNLLVRRSAFMAVGRFKDGMHVGEDVDLTWRLRDSGWTITYLPLGRVFHEHRNTIRSFMSRRFDYGTSEGLLQRLHPQRRKRMVIPPLFVLLLTLLLLAPVTGGWSLLGFAVVTLFDTFAVRRKLRRNGLQFGISTLLAGRLRAFGSLLYYLSYHLVRYYTIPLLAVTLVYPVSGLVLLAALLCASRVDHAVKKPHLSFALFFWVYLLEQAAYGAGVFWGCVNRKTFASYRVNIIRQAELPV